jgi:glycosyltransferase involved in cell wall biosynthesis
MTQFALPYSTYLTQPQSSNRQGPKIIFDAHNAVWTIVERMRQNAPWILKLPATVEARRIKRYEGNVVKNFDYVLAVTEPDRKALLEALEVKEETTRDSSDPNSQIKPISVIPIAVDTQQLQPAHRQPDSYNIVTLGTLHYPPNADGIRWFMQEVFPKVCQEVPQARLTIIGKNPPADFLQYAAQHSQAIKVTGYVQDLAPYVDQAAVMVVAVRAGGGMRVRILEAFARAMPVVTTTVGLEGIQAQPGEEVLVADTPKAFANEVIRLLKDPALQARLAENGRRLAETCYDWQVVLTKMDEVYGKAGKETISEK